MDVNSTAPTIGAASGLALASIDPLIALKIE